MAPVDGKWCKQFMLPTGWRTQTRYEVALVWLAVSYATQEDLIRFYKQSIFGYRNTSSPKNPIRTGYRAKIKRLRTQIDTPIRLQPVPRKEYFPDRDGSDRKSND